MRWYSLSDEREATQNQRLSTRGPFELKILPLGISCDKLDICTLPTSSATHSLGNG